jgi:hypothetical protein
MRREEAGVFFTARSAKQPSLPVAIFIFKPEILRMLLYAMWLNRCGLFKMTPLKDELTDFATG